MTLTDRYVAATLRSVPAAQQADIEQELRASVADAIDAQVESGVDPDVAETAVLNDLGDPGRLAAGLADRPLYLIGPELFLVWWRLLKALLWIALIPGAVVLTVDLADGVAAGSAIVSGLGTAISVAMQIALWTTVVFAVLERTGTRPAELTGPWTVDRLPADHPPRAVSLVDTVVSVGLLVLVAAALLLQRTVSWTHLPEGRAIPVLHPDMWPVWTAVLVAIVAVEIALTIVVYARGRWTVALATVNTVTGALFAGIVIVLASTDRLVNPAFLEASGGASLSWLSQGIIATTVVIAVWDVADVWVKTLRGRTA